MFRYVNRVPSVVVTVKCVDCHHEQQAKSVGDYEDEKGVHRYFGSAYRFCNECDGVVEPVKTSALN